MSLIFFAQANRCYEITSDKSLKPASQHPQSRRKSMEPIPRVETSQPDGSRWTNTRGMGDYDSRREYGRAGL